MPNFVAVKQGMNRPRAIIQYLNTMNTTTEQRRHYERPRTTVVELQQASQMMQASQRGRGGVQNYNMNTSQSW